MYNLGSSLWKLGLVKSRAHQDIGETAIKGGRILAWWLRLQKKAQVALALVKACPVATHP